MPQAPDHRLDESQSLALLSAVISVDVICAMRSAIVTGAAALQFHNQRDWFATHPGNSLTWMALDALEERCVVRISERLKDEARALTIPTEVRRKSDLRLHRHAVSHPLTLTWRDKDMQRFQLEQQRQPDFRPALVWDLQRSVNDLLRSRGLTPGVEEIDVAPEMVLSLCTILRFSMRPEASARLPSEPEHLQALTIFRDRYMDFVVARGEQS